jgi:4-carboxymuconolactone decarboxylase
LPDLGTANQTKLAGAPVTGPQFEFAPAIDEYLKDHLFGDIFARDNLDWQSRELATVAALAAMSGVESQMQFHLGLLKRTQSATCSLRKQYCFSCKHSEVPRKNNANLKYLLR